LHIVTSHYGTCTFCRLRRQACPPDIYNPDPKFIPIKLKKLTVPIKKEKKETEKKKTKNRKQKKGTEKTKQKKSPKEERPPVVRVDSDGEDVGDSEVCSDSDDARPLGRSRRQCNTPEPRPKPNPNPNPNPKPKLKPKPEPEPEPKPNLRLCLSTHS
jgi:hypothetical protein